MPNRNRPARSIKQASFSLHKKLVLFLCHCIIHIWLFLFRWPLPDLPLCKMIEVKVKVGDSCEWYTWYYWCSSTNHIWLRIFMWHITFPKRICINKENCTKMEGFNITILLYVIPCFETVSGCFTAGQDIGSSIRWLSLYSVCRYTKNSGWWHIDRWGQPSYIWFRNSWFHWTDL